MYQPFCTGLFLSKKMQCYQTLIFWEELFEFYSTFIPCNISYLKTKVSHVFQLIHISKGTHSLFEPINISFYFLKKIKFDFAF